MTISVAIGGCACAEKILLFKSCNSGNSVATEVQKKSTFHQKVCVYFICVCNNYVCVYVC